MMTREESLDLAMDLNEAAGKAIIQGQYQLAASILSLAATYSPSEEGRKALYARALEASAMEHGS